MENQQTTPVSQTNPVPVIPTPPVTKLPPPSPQKNLVIIAVSLLFIALIAAALIIFLPTTKKSLTSDLSQNTDTTTPYTLNYKFADYKLANTTVSPSLPAYTISISELTNLPNFETALKTSFTDSQKATLTESNFFITKNNDQFYQTNPEEEVMRTDDWANLYRTIGGGAITQRKPENAVFISTDSVLHVYHRLLEKNFEYIEKNNLYPQLKEITDNIYNQALKNYSFADTANRESYARVIAYFAVPKAIIDTSYPEFVTKTPEDQKLDSDASILQSLDSLKSAIPAVSYQKAKEEMTLILAKKDVIPSPLFGELLSSAGLQSNQDYTQFTPRSHYAKNSVLRAYFRAMMWYGRNYFALSSADLTRDAVNITLLTNSTNSLKNWESIYVTTAFLAGKSDDLGLIEYNTSLQYSGKTSADDTLIAAIQKDMAQYGGPQIQSVAFFGDAISSMTKEELLAATKGFRFMGQRFTPDAFVFSSLTQGDEKPDPETGEKLPSATTALLAMNVLGSKTAETLSQEWINTNAPASKKVMANKTDLLRKDFAKIPDSAWTQNIYWGWLYSLKSLFTEDTNKTGYPMFMKNDAWNKKSLLTSLGSWTELKHDTLLYAKQSYAEMGGGPGDDPIPAVPKGYVEPNIVFYDRILALIDMTQQGLSNRGLLDSLFKGRYTDLLEGVKFFRSIAVKELQNEKITDEDFETLRNSGSIFTNTLFVLPGEVQFEKNARSALIADVHTDAVKGNILYEADGIPNYIYVAVKDVNGTRLTKGLVYDYYEFTNPLTERLTDEKWQSLNYTTDKSKLPASPTWVAPLVK